MSGGRRAEGQWSTRRKPRDLTLAALRHQWHGPFPLRSGCRFALNDVNHTATWNAAALLVGSHHHIAERFLVIALSLAAKELGEFVNCSSLFPVHGREAMASGLLLRLASHLHQLRERLVHGQHEGGVLAGLVLEEVRIAGRPHTARHVCILDLQRAGQPPVALQNGTLLVALQPCGPCPGEGHGAANVDALPQLKVLYLGGQQGRRQLVEARLDRLRDATGKLLRAPATLARYAHQGLAGGGRWAGDVWVAGLPAGVAARRAGGGAGLGAGPPGGRLGGALARMARLLAPVLAAGEVAQAGAPARQALQEAGHRTPLLMVAEAPLFGERSAWRAGGVAVAVVGDKVAARVLPGTRLVAFGRPCATRYRCTQASAATVAAQVFKTDVPAGWAVSAVTGLLAHVLAAGEPLAAHERAAVFRVHAAQHEALVAAALAPLLAPPLAQLLGAVAAAARQLHAGDLARGGPAPAAHGARQRARRARTLVARCVTLVRAVLGTAHQELPADAAARGNRVDARLPRGGPLDTVQGPLAARAVHHGGRQQGAAAALAKVAHRGALVGATVQGPSALLATRELPGRIGLPGAQNLPPLLVAVALLVHEASTGVTDVGMAPRLADVDPAVEKAATGLSAAHFLLLAAAHLPGELPAGAGPAYGGTARWALAGVALQVAAVDAE